MKKNCVCLFVIIALFMMGCSNGNNSAPKENIVINLTHHSTWEPYESVDEFGEGYELAEEDMTFMTSNNQYIRTWMFWELSYILYDYSQQTNQNLLADYWEVERITPIGNDYYNALLHQKAQDVRADLLFNPFESEYKILYVVCNSGDHITYNGLSYLTQSTWMTYTEDNSDENYEMDDLVNNPFLDIYETSSHMALLDALTTYQHETGYIGTWTVQEVYKYSSLENYLLVTEDRVVWFCLDVYTNEYTAETFYIEKQ